MKKITDQYPRMFTQPSYQYGWPSGWNELVSQLIDDVSKASDEVEVLQIKEKFAGLRFYYSHGNEAVRDLVEEAEKKSYTICQDCGADGAGNCVGPYGWMSTLCETCDKKRQD